MLKTSLSTLFLYTVTLSISVVEGTYLSLCNKDADPTEPIQISYMLPSNHMRRMYPYPGPIVIHTTTWRSSVDLKSRRLADYRE